MFAIGSYVVQVQHKPVESSKINSELSYPIACRDLCRNMNESDTVYAFQALLEAGIIINIALKTKYAV